MTLKLFIDKIFVNSQYCDFKCVWRLKDSSIERPHKNENVNGTGSVFFSTLHSGVFNNIWEFLNRK